MMPLISSLTMHIIPPLIYLSIFPLIANAQPTQTDYFNTLFSQAFYVTQCVSHRIIADTGIPDENIRKANTLGFSVTDFWSASKLGAKGEVYDMLQEKWVKVPFNKK